MKDEGKGERNGEGESDVEGEGNVEGERNGKGERMVRARARAGAYMVCAIQLVDHKLGVQEGGALAKCVDLCRRCPLGQ